MSEELLTKDQVLQTVEFADALYNIDKYGYFSPWLSNQNLVGLTNTPKAPKIEALKKTLADYKNQAQDLRDYVQFMQHFDMLFARTFESYAKILAYDLQITCSNAFTEEDYQSDEYARDKKIVYKFLDSFDYKAEFAKVTQQVLRNGVGYFSFRQTHGNTKDMKATLQVLPQSHCMLTGYWEKGALADFNMALFLQPGVDIEGYAPEFRKYFQKVFGEGQSIDNYIPSNQFSTRNGVYGLWTQTSPDVVWAFLLDMTDFSAVPFLAPYLKDALLDDEIEMLQRSKDIASAYAILAGEIRLFDNAKSGTKADQFAIAPATLVDFMKKVKMGLPNEIKAVAMPTENSKFYQYSDGNKDMLTNQLSVSSGVGSSLSRVIYSTDRMSNAELQFSAEAQGQIMKAMYPQYANFLEYFVNKMTKKYHFKFHFEGLDYEFERQARFDRLLKASDKGLVLNPTAYASALGMTPQMFERSLMESKASGWVQKLSQLLLNTNTTAQNEGGRPNSDNLDLSDSGEANRNQ